MRNISVWRLGNCDGKHPAGEYTWERTSDFPDKEVIAAHLGFPLGSIHNWYYGVMADGRHSYRVESIEMLTHVRNGEYYGWNQYLITLRFHEDLTPDSHWTRIGCKSSPTQTITFKGPDGDVDGLYAIERLPVTLMRDYCGYSKTVLRNQNLELSPEYVEQLMAYKPKATADKEPWELTWQEFKATVPDGHTCGGMGGYVSYAFKSILEPGCLARYRFKWGSDDYWVNVKVIEAADLGTYRVRFLESVLVKEMTGMNKVDEKTFDKGHVATVYSTQLHPMPDNDVYQAYQDIRKKAYLEGKPIFVDDTSRRGWAEEALKQGMSLPMACLADAPTDARIHPCFMPIAESAALNREYNELMRRKQSKNKKDTLTPADHNRIKQIEAISQRCNEGYTEWRSVERALRTMQPVDDETLRRYPDLAAKYEGYPFRAVA